MSTPVTTDKWAGTFQCEGPCGRSRLTGSEFSRNMLEKHRTAARTGKNKKPLRCKKCVADVEVAERKAAAERRAKEAATADGAGTSGPSAAGGKEEQFYDCAGPCGGKKMASSEFNRNQLSKGPGKARCRACVEQSIKDESKSIEQKNADEIAAAKEALKKAEAGGNSVEILKASNHLSALEAQHVTGLKPVVLGRGKSRGGRGRGRTSGRGGRFGGRTAGSRK